MVPHGEYIAQIELRTGGRIDSLTFVTNKGNKSPKYGGDGGYYHLVTLPEGYRLIGLYGKHGYRFYFLGFILGKTVYNKT